MMFEKPIRMCIHCRNRAKQDSMYRLQIRDGRLDVFCGSGRSFYLCQECLKRENAIKSIIKASKIFFKKREIGQEKREIDANMIKTNFEELLNLWIK